MPTKTRTKKPAAKPQRMPRKPRPANPSAEEIGCVIGRHAGYTIASCLEDLLSLRDKPGFDAVSAAAAEKLGDGLPKYRASYATDTEPERVSPVEEALRRLSREILSAEAATEAETAALSALLPPGKPDSVAAESPRPPSSSGQLTGMLNDFADRLSADNIRRASLLGRLDI